MDVYVIPTEIYTIQFFCFQMFSPSDQLVLDVWLQEKLKQIFFVWQRWSQFRVNRSLKPNCTFQSLPLIRRSVSCIWLPDLPAGHAIIRPVIQQQFMRHVLPWVQYMAQTIFAHLCKYNLRQVKWQTAGQPSIYLKLHSRRVTSWKIGEEQALRR